MDAGPVSMAGPRTLVSNAAGLTGYRPSEPDHSRSPGPSASGSTFGPLTGLLAASTAA